MLQDVLTLHSLQVISEIYASNAFFSYNPNGFCIPKKLGLEKLWWSTYQIIMVICTRYPAKLSGYQASVAHLRV